MQEMIILLFKFPTTDTMYYNGESLGKIALHPLDFSTELAWVGIHYTPHSNSE